MTKAEREAARKERWEEAVAEAPEKFITVERDKFRLTLFERESTDTEFKSVKVYKVAIGDKDIDGESYRTPKGLFIISEKVKNPDWQMPNSPWVPEDQRGVIIPGGDPANPLKSRWMTVVEDEGIGIHGTSDEASIGAELSHGCIRMKVPEIEELYDLVKVGTGVYID